MTADAPSQAASPAYVSLFSGCGGLDLGFDRAGWRCLVQVERFEGSRAILAQHWPSVPRFTDIRDVTGVSLARACGGEIPRPFALVGGFPCIDVSQAGKREGLDGAHSGLWREYARLIEEVRPDLVVIENVKALLYPKRGGLEVLSDLAARGYDASWDIVPADALGAPHLRERVFFVAWPAPRAVPDAVGLDLRYLRERRGKQRGKPGAAEPGVDGTLRPLADAAEPRPQGRQDAGAGGGDAGEGARGLEPLRGDRARARGHRGLESEMADATRERGLDEAGHLDSVGERAGRAVAERAGRVDRDAATVADADVHGPQGERRARRDVADVRRDPPGDFAHGRDGTVGRVFDARLLALFREEALGAVWRRAEPGLGGVAHGLPAGVDGGGPTDLAPGVDAQEEAPAGATGDGAVATAGSYRSVEAWERGIPRVVARSELPRALPRRATKEERAALVLEKRRIRAEGQVRKARLWMLGNAVVPQVGEYVGRIALRVLRATWRGTLGS